MVGGLAYQGMDLISDGEGVITEVTSTLPSSTSSLEITLKDVVNMQSVRPLNAMFIIELSDSNGALIAEGETELIDFQILQAVSIEDVTVTRQS